MLKLQPNPTFKAKVSIPTPGGEKVEVELTLRHMTREGLEQFLTGPEAKDRSDEDSIMAIVSAWSGVDAEFSRDSVALLLQQYHAAGRAIVSAWVSELTQARLGN
jgi:hypothetical protein